MPKLRLSRLITYDSAVSLTLLTIFCVESGVCWFDLIGVGGRGDLLKDVDRGGAGGGLFPREERYPGVIGIKR